MKAKDVTFILKINTNSNQMTRWRLKGQKCVKIMRKASDGCILGWVKPKIPYHQCCKRPLSSYEKLFHFSSGCLWFTKRKLLHFLKFFELQAGKLGDAQLKTSNTKQKLKSNQVPHYICIMIIVLDVSQVGWIMITNFYIN